MSRSQQQKSAIPPPTPAQVAAAEKFAARCYPARGARAELFLVPHAGVDESRACTAAALAALAPGATVLVVGVDHAGAAAARPPLQIVDLASTADHSLHVPAAFLGGREATFALLGTGASAAECAGAISAWRKPGRAVVFSVDLTHYWPNQDAATAAEAPLLAALLRPDPAAVARAIRAIRPPAGAASVDGPKELETLAALAAASNLEGWVACYTDSRGKRDGWSTEDGDPAVSYAGIAWGKKRAAMSAFEESLLVAFARSAVIAAARGAPPPRLPAWSAWHAAVEGAFVGAKVRGEVVGSIGRYERAGASTAAHVAAAAADIPADAAERWRRPIGPGKDAEELDVYVNVLEPERAWRDEAPSAVAKARRAGPEGLFLALPGGRGATYLPGVWAEVEAGKGRPVPGDEILTMLAEKAGAAGDAWRAAGARVRVYRTRLLTLCDFA